MNKFITLLITTLLITTTSLAFADQVMISAQASAQNFDRVDDTDIPLYFEALRGASEDLGVPVCHFDGFKLRLTEVMLNPRNIQDHIDDHDLKLYISRSQQPIFKLVVNDEMFASENDKIIAALTNSLYPDAPRIFVGTPVTIEFTFYSDAQYKELVDIHAKVTTPGKVERINIGTLLDPVFQDVAKKDTVADLSCLNSPFKPK